MAGSKALRSIRACSAQSPPPTPYGNTMRGTSTGTFAIPVGLCMPISGSGMHSGFARSAWLGDLEKKGEKHVSQGMRPLMERLARRDAEVERLKAENQRLIEQFVVRLYNVQIRGIGQAELGRPLPRVDRAQTKAELRVVGSGRRTPRA